MKPLLTTVAILFLFIGCRKSDIHLIRGKLVKCDVAEQSPVTVGYLVGNGFKKTYYDDGLVKSVLTKMNSAFIDFDSLSYTFTYASNKAYVNAYRWSFRMQGVGPEEPPIIIPDENRPPEQYSFTVDFDPKTLNAIKAGSTVFEYDQYGRLLSYDDFGIEYDNKGNIIKINTANGGSVVFTYDYAKTAKRQLYYTTGFMTNEMYNLMEIMGWIPVEPNNLRLTHTLFPETDLFFGEFFFLDHVVNKDGLLTSFRESFDEGGTAPSNTVINTWSCQPVSEIIKHEK